jgi:hypothetical protein
MPLFDDAGNIPSTQLQRPMQRNGTGDNFALAVEQYSGVVEGTIERRSVMQGWVPMRPVQGTNTLTDFAVGEATLGKVTPGEAPEASKVDFSKASIVVDTLVYARNTMPLLDTFQSSYDARAEIGREHGKKIAKFLDQSFFIQGAKAALLANSRFANGAAGKPAGHKGGSVQTLPSAAAVTDPAQLYAAIAQLFVKMEEKDVIPREDDVMLCFRPKEFYTLQDAEQIVNGTYVTSDGTRMDNVAIFKAYGCPVISSNNLPNTNIAGHLLSNAANSNAYDGDFTKLAGLALSARALLAGETIPLSSDVFYDKTYKTWFVDSHLSYAVTPNRAEYAGAILLP